MRHDINTKLRRRRFEVGMPAITLARLMGVKPAALCVLEQRGLRSKRLAFKYSQWLDCEPEDIMETPQKREEVHADS